MRIREKLLQAEIAAAKLGIREVGANNHGPWVKKFLAEVGLPEGFAWCDAFQAYEIHAAAGRRLSIESASVWATYLEALRLGWVVVGRPEAEDLVLYDFDGDGRADDHIGIIVSVGAFGPRYWKLNTVEGNTSSGKAGSQTDGGGVYLRTRIVRRSSVRFVRIPGVVPDPPKPKPRPKPKRSPVLHKGARGLDVRTLQTLLRKHGATVKVDGVFGQRTLASLRAFQKRKKLRQTGVVDARTWRALRS